MALLINRARAINPGIDAGSTHGTSSPLHHCRACVQLHRDLDRFKQLNDLHGHDAGDRALRSFSRTLRESLRPQDIICRWGGEEFVVVLPGCDTPRAVEAMNRVRTNLALGSMSGNAADVTASFGVAQACDADLFAEVVERADAALHQAKAGGRNRVVGFDMDPLPAAAKT